MPTPFDIVSHHGQLVRTRPNIEADVREGHEALDPPNVILIPVRWEGFPTTSLQAPTLINISAFAWWGLLQKCKVLPRGM